MRFVGIIIAIALATPTFWLGLLFILISVSRHWLPASGYVSFVESPVDAATHLLLPAPTLGTYGTAVLIRFLSTSIMTRCRLTTCAWLTRKGLRERSVVIRHALQVALPPVVTIMAIQFGQLLGGAVVTESVFGWPGLGRLILDAIGNRDYLVVQSTMLLFVTIFIALNVIADVVCAPRSPHPLRGDSAAIRA